MAAHAKRSILVIFTTSHTSEEYQLPDEKRQLLVRADSTRTDLSKVLNSEGLLGNDPAVPFQFKVVTAAGDAGYLRSTLGTYLEESGNAHTDDDTVTLEYVASIHPPAFEQTFQPHDDWICDVDVLVSPLSGGGGGVDHDRCLATSYDGIVRVTDRHGFQLAQAPSTSPYWPAQRPNTGKWLSPTRIATSGFSGVVLVSDYTESSSSSGPGGRRTANVKPALELVGHRRQIFNLDTHRPTNRILTASADGKVGFWSGDKAEGSEPDPWFEEWFRRPNKRRRTLSSNVGPLPRRGPLAMIPMRADGDVMNVNQAIFHPNDASVAYAACDDGVLRTIDLTTQKIVASPFKAEYGDNLGFVAPLGRSSSMSSLLAVGQTADRVARIVDPRIGAGAGDRTVVMTLRGHANRVQCAAASPRADPVVVTGSWDSYCRVFDLRGAGKTMAVVATTATTTGAAEAAPPDCRSTWTVPREWLRAKKKVDPVDSKAKVFKVQWERHWGIVSCGEDKQVQLNHIEIPE